MIGFSDGGIVGLLVAIARPDLVRKLVVIGANYDADGVAPEAEAMFAGMTPDAEEMAMFRGLYEMHSPDGPEHWPVVFGKFVEMVKREPHISLDDLAGISAPTLVIIGDDDLVTIEHTAALLPRHPELGARRDPRRVPHGPAREARDREPGGAHVPRERAPADDAPPPACGGP